MERAIQIFNLNQIDKIWKQYDRVYLWVDSCIFKNIFEEQKLNEFLDFLKLRNLSLTIVSALLPEIFVNDYKKFLEIILDSWIRDLEITINDFWVFQFLKKWWYLDKKDDQWNFLIKINIWTNLYYQIKDPYAVVVEKADADRISIDNEYYDKFFQKQWYNALESYIPLSWYKNHCLDFPLYVYYPYVMYSFTRACPWKLIEKWESKSRLLKTCDWCPKDYYKNITRQKLIWKDFKYESIYVPNAQYYKNEFNIEQFKPTRLIDNHLLIQED